MFMFDLGMLTSVLVLIILSLHLRFRQKENIADIGRKTVGESFRWTAIGLLAYLASGWGIRLIDAWYTAGGAPSIEWKGILWIGAVIVAIVSAYLVGIVLTFTKRKQPRP